MLKTVVIKYDKDTAQHKAQFCIDAQVVDHKCLTDLEYQILIEIEYLTDSIKHGLTQGVRAEKLYSDIIESGFYEDCNFLLMLGALVEA